MPSSQRPNRMNRESNFLKEKKSWSLSCLKLKECPPHTCAVAFLNVSFTRGVGVSWTMLAACLACYVLVFTNRTICAIIAINECTSWTVSCLNTENDDSKTKKKEMNTKKTDMNTDKDEINTEQDDRNIQKDDL